MSTKKEIEQIQTLQGWLKPTLPFSLLFSHKREALQWLEDIRHVLEHYAHLEEDLSLKATLITDLQQQITQLELAVAEGQNSITDLQNELEKSIQTLSNELQKKEKEITSFSADIKRLNTELEDYKTRHQLVSKLISTANGDLGVTQFYHLLTTEFLPFANKLAVLPDEAATILELYEIGKELKLASANPEFYKKRTIAVAGGFSAGKSAFISSLFISNHQQKLMLPIGIDPTTAIPTYVLHSEQRSLIACNNEGGIINLLENYDGKQRIENLQKFTTHQFLTSFGFRLQNLMPFIFLCTPLNYEHLCFIDTPGYNPANYESTSEDSKVSKNFIHNSEAFIWVIGLDSNGTISYSDINFINEILEGEENKPLYIVLNKADLKPSSTIQEVLDEICERLDDEDIVIQGISAYSSSLRKEMAYRQSSLMEFLHGLDKQSISKYQRLKQRLNIVHNKYKDAINHQIEHNKKISDRLNLLDFIFIGKDDRDEDEASSIIGELKLSFNSNSMKEHLIQLDNIMDKMQTAIDTVFNHKQYNQDNSKN